MWKFNEIQSTEDLSFNKSLETFFKMGPEGLIRENIQNSLDAAILNSSSPVKVEISCQKINQKNLPGFDNIQAHIRALKGGNPYSRGTIKHMKRALELKEVLALTFDDTNTRGLKYAGKNNCESDTYCAYAYKKGVHNVDANDEHESIRGGSHGMGKIAANAMSDLSLMYFANCDDKGVQHLGGTIQLIDHEMDGISYRSTGYFTDLKEKEYEPYPNDFGALFEKKTRGLKIIVPFFTSQFNHHEFIRFVCDNFFMSIIENKLIVQLNDQTIDDNNIQDIIADPAIYPKSLQQGVHRNYTALYVSTYLNIKQKEIVIQDKNRENYQFALHLDYNPRIERGRVAIIRRIGMKIKDMKLQNMAKIPFNAVLIPYGEKEDSFLKTLENESHTELTEEHIQDPQTRRNAKTFLSSLHKELCNRVAAAMKASNPTDCKIETKNLIEITEYVFATSIKDSTAIVRISKGDKKKGKALVVTRTNQYKKRENPTQKPEPTRTKKGQKRDKGNGNNNTDKPRPMFALEPEMIHRLVFNNQEVVTIHLSQHEQYYGESSCRIRMNVLDGYGNPLKESLNVSDIYNSALDKLSDTFLTIKKNIIEKISIKEGTIFLMLQWKEGANQALKFSYDIEL